MNGNFDYVGLDKEVLKVKLPKFKFTNCWIAGGAIRDSILGVKYTDIDIFGKSKEDLDLFIKENLSGYKLTFQNESLKNFIKNDTKVQVIYKFYNSINDTLDSFDFTICQFAFDGESVICNHEAIVHIYEKKLVINKIQEDFVFDSFRRLQKYIQKGYSICNGGIKEFIEITRGVTQEKMDNQVSFYPEGNPRFLRYD